MRIRAAACVVGVGVLVLAAPARADTTIGFDDRAPDPTTNLTNQYASDGIVFGTDPYGSTTDGQLYVKQQNPGAHSPPNVGAIGFGGEIPQSRVWAHFDKPRSHVSVYVGTGSSAPNPQPSFNAEMDAYDFAGDLLPSLTQTASVPQDGTVHTLLNMSDSVAEISYIRLTNGSGPATSDFVIDDLSFDAGSSQPDFALNRNGSAAPVHLNAGQASVAVPVTLHRTNGSTGSISLGLSGVPPGVTVSGLPSSTSGPDGTTFNLIFSASANAPPAETQVTITGSATNPAAGPVGHPRSVSIPLTVTGTVDLRAQGIELTQGIQQPGLLIPSGAANPGAYHGVRLVEGQPTVARVYADAHGAAGSGVAGVGVTLRGIRNGKTIGVLLPQDGPTALHDSGSCACVSQDERLSGSFAYTFTLPASWAHGEVSLQASVALPAPSLGFNAPAFSECAGCASNNTFTLTTVDFTPTPHLVIAPVQMLISGQPPEPNPIDVFSQARIVHPGALQFEVLPYQGTIDVTQINNSSDPNLDKNTAYFNAVNNWDATNGADPNSYDFAFGINEQQRGASNWSDYELPLSNPSSNDVAHHGISFGTPGRPLTSIGHELGHNLGDAHAGPACDKGGNGIDWPPDQRGEIEGIGLDMRKSPYRVLYGGLPLEPPAWYDLMSYCANTNETPSVSNFPDAWISTVNWEHEIDGLELYSARVQQSHHAADRSAAAGQQLLVLAQALPGGATTIVQTSHLPAGERGIVGPSGARFRLIARDAAGSVVSNVPMDESLGHGDPGKYFDTLSATVPLRRVTSVQITSGGTVVASRSASRHAPRVKILSPRRRMRVGGSHGVLVRFRASDTDRDRLSALIDYSRNGGRNYNTVWSGGAAGRVRLPSYYFAASHHARVRIRVDDGFNETTVVSKPFTARGARPQVSITSPAKGTAVIADATLPFTGTAFDDASRALRRRALRWSLDGVTLGHGASIAVAGLPTGRSRIVLTARDHLGRRSSKSIVIHASAPKLPWLRLKVPRSIRHRARRLVLRAASSVPATLDIGRRHVRLHARRHSVRIGVRRHGHAILLRIVVDARGVKTPLVFVVKRR